MSPGYDDDDDWSGTPPEGHHTRDQSDPEAWRKPFRAQTIVYGLIGLGIVVVVILALVAS
ncbi:hypothetical protein [Conexibacter woesei]|jgi:hypothetical protein|uniref:hypothetical protein n=1 Tax=Conexibacter woesei TaxID=191495 RepID=UPI0003FAD699|nr:hypothetical protein [Conexibacter woesei]